VVASLAYNRDGIHPEVMAMIEGTTPDDLAGSVFHQAYLGASPDPEQWPTLVAKCNRLDREFDGWPAQEIRSRRPRW
jgi:hypothetical protein